MSAATQKFREVFKKFEEAEAYINKNYDDLKKDPERLGKVQRNFKAKYEKPLDDVWASLTEDEQASLATLYFLHRKGVDEEIDELLKEAGNICETFSTENTKAKIVNISLKKQGEDDDE